MQRSSKTSGWLAAKNKSVKNSGHYPPACFYLKDSSLYIFYEIERFKPESVEGHNYLKICYIIIFYTVK